MGMVLDPVVMNQALEKASSAGDKKSRGRIWEQLKSVDFNWLLKLAAAFRENKLTYNSAVCQQFLRHVAQRSCGVQLIDWFADATFRHVETTEAMEQNLVLLFHWLYLCPIISIQALKECQRRSTTKSNLSFLLFCWLKRRGLIEVVTESVGPFSIRYQPGQVTYFSWVIPTSLQELARSLLKQCQALLAEEERAIQQAWSQPIDWPSAELLWQKIKARACCGLHVDGGDEIRFAIPELRAIRLTGATIRPKGVFPAASVIVHTNTMGVAEDLEFDLVPGGRLQGSESYWMEYFQWLVAMTILAGYWQIVGGNETEHWGGLQSDAGLLQEAPSSRRPAKPHPYRLPAGWHPSDRAIANCRIVLGRDPRPGYTFRMPEKIPAAKNGGKVSAVVTRETIAKTLSS
jgi:hypothetical protein